MSRRAPASRWTSGLVQRDAAHYCALTSRRSAAKHNRIESEQALKRKKHPNLWKDEVKYGYEKRDQNFATMSACELV